MNPVEFSDALDSFNSIVERITGQKDGHSYVHIKQKSSKEDMEKISTFMEDFIKEANKGPLTNKNIAQVKEAYDKLKTAFEGEIDLDEVEENQSNVRKINEQIITLSLILVMKESDNVRALCEAIEKGDIEKVKKLIESHDINLGDDSLKRTLYNLLRSHHLNIEIVEVLLRYGMDVNQKIGTGITEWDKSLSNDSLLHFAIEEGNVDLVKLLINNSKIDANNPDRTGVSALENAIIRGNQDIIKILVDSKKVKLDIPIIKALARDNLDAIKILVNLGKIDINEPLNKDNQTIVHLAVLNGCKKETLEFLKEIEADFNKGDKFGRTPIHYAAVCNLSSLKTLVQCGSNIDQVDNTGRSALVAVRSLGDETAAKELIRLGADNMFAQKCLNRIYLGHVWGEEGPVKVLDSSEKEINLALTGFLRHYPLKNIAQSVMNFVDSQIDQELSSQDKDAIKDAFENIDPVRTRSNQEIVNRIKQERKPFIISTGPANHAICVAFAKGKMIVSNRGEGRENNAIVIYDLPMEKVTEEFIESIKPPLDLGLFKDLIIKMGLKEIGGIYQKPQNIDSCSVANAKSIVMGLLFAYLRYKDDAILSPTENDRANISARVIAKKLYKEFTLYERQESLKVVIEEATDFDKPLLANIQNKYRKKALKKFIKEGDWPKVRDLFKDDVNTVNDSYIYDIYSNLSPLQIAVEYGKKDIIRELHTLGANLNKVNQSGSPLHVAIEKGDVEVIELLIELGADINIVDQNGMSLLQLAVNNNDMEMVKTLKRLGANIHLEQNKRLIKVALEKGNIKLLEALCEGEREGILPKFLKFVSDKNPEEIQKALIAFAYLASSQNENRPPMNIENFKLDEEALIEIAKLAAQQKGNETSL